MRFWKCFVCGCLAIWLGTRSVQGAEEVVATVNGEPIRRSQLQLDFYLRQLPDSATPQQRRQLLERLIDQQLIRQFLQERKVEPPQDRIERDLSALRRVLEQADDPLEVVLEKLSLDEQAVREMLALPLAWRRHVEQVLTEPRLSEFWAEHRHRFDGTRVRAAQIVKTLTAESEEADWTAAEEQLSALRRRITEEELTFAEAARQHSDSPSGERGGDLGEFEYADGRVAEAISRVAFTLEPGETSEPFRTRFGVHLVRVTQRTPGELSLEDVREQVLNELARRKWEEQVREERSRAEIEILEVP
jgi:parvulin-like peptidyl-prolyl isomerase